MVIFKFKQKKFEGDLKIKICGKRLYHTESVKYEGKETDTNFSCHYHVNDLFIKLNRANALFLKIRKYLSLEILRSICFAIFYSYLSCCCSFWAQNCNIAKKKKKKRLLELLVFYEGALTPVSYSKKVPS